MRRMPRAATCTSVSMRIAHAGGAHGAGVRNWWEPKEQYKTSVMYRVSLVPGL